MTDTRSTTPRARSFLWRLLVPALLLLSLFVVTYPRFNRQDAGVVEDYVGRARDGNKSEGDTAEYVRGVRYFRGEVPKGELTTPFAYRPGVPYLAAQLSIKDPMTALNAINMAGLAVALVFLYRILRVLGYRPGDAAAGNFLFVFSFPVFYYGPVGLVDPAGMAVVAAGVDTLFRRHWFGLCIVAMVGALIRETSAVVVIVAAAGLLVMRPKNAYLVFVGVVVAFAVPTILIRGYFADYRTTDGRHPGATFSRTSG